MAKDLQQRTIVITGCDVPNSYGYELALCLDKQGYNIFAGCTDCNSVGARSLASRGSTRLAILQIDVTKQDEIEDAKEMIEDIVGDEGVWAVVNCAESYAVAEVDWFSPDDFNQIMQVNFLGTVRVTKALLPLLRKAKGRVVNLSNISGCVSRAGLSAFAASKYALEAFSDSLRQEMLKWGVFVSVVQPAFVPEGETVLGDAETSVRLKRVPQETRDLYGDDYFAKYINSVSGSFADLSDQQSRSKSALSTESKSISSSGYSSLSSTQSSIKSESPNGLNHRKSKFENKTSSLQKADPKQDLKEVESNEKQKGFSTLSSSACATLKSNGQVDLTNMNRVLHALVEAVTSQSPKVRYFVGSFQDRMLKVFSPIMPTVFVDHYFTSGEMAKVVPKHIKEKLD